VDPIRRYPFLRELLSPFWKRHRKTLGLVIVAIAHTGQARSFAIATTLAHWLGTRLDSAINRFYRLLRNTRIDYTSFVAQWAQVLVRRADRRALVAIDWTEWSHDLRMLVAAVVTGTRAIPLFAQAFPKAIRLRSQNARENTFLRLLADGLRRAQMHAVILCDRGFRRVSWLKLLGQLQLDFVIRLMDDVYVEPVDGLRLALSQVLLTPGGIEDLGFVPLRQDGAATVRVIGYWAPGATQPWWLATNLTCAARDVLSLYDRRMTVEEQFRDLKGKRFGVKLAWTQFRDPEALWRFMLLLAVALLIWQLAGHVAAAVQPSLRLISRSKGARQSHVTIGTRELLLGRVRLRFSLRNVHALIPEPAMRRLGRLTHGGK
jgi:hypothetical protein